MMWTPLPRQPAPAIRHPYLIAAALLPLLSPFTIAQQSIAPDETARDRPAIHDEMPPAVQLSIDFGDGFQKSYRAIPWSADDMTVADAMQFAAQHAHATKFETRGENDTAFLSSIDGVKNQGYGKRSWIFHINGSMAEESFGTVKLQVGDAILWRFQEFP